MDDYLENYNSVEEVVAVLLLWNVIWRHSGGGSELRILSKVSNQDFPGTIITLTRPKDLERRHQSVFLLLQSKFVLAIALGLPFLNLLGVVAL